LSKKRQTLAGIIREQAIAWCIARATVEEIDTLNILKASLLAMKRAVEGLCVSADLALVDGNQRPDLACEGTDRGRRGPACSLHFRSIYPRKNST